MELPPVLKIATDERLWTKDSPQALKEYLSSRDLGRELSEQAEWSVEKFEYVDGTDRRNLPAGFTVIPSGSLNPFSPIAKCAGESCTIEATEDFIKSVGLYTEQAVLADPITEHFLEDHKHTEECYVGLVRNLKIMEKLLPLLESGVLLMARPVHQRCSDCMEKVDILLTEATESLLDIPYEHRARVLSKNGRFKLRFEMPVLQPDHSHPLSRIVDITKVEAALLSGVGSARKMSRVSRDLLRSIIAKTLKGQLSKVLFELEMSEGMGSLLLAGSRAETLVISVLDSRKPNIARIEDWEKLRTIHLPWVANLTTEEVLTLRGEADKALPRLRELLRVRLADINEGASSLERIVNELREQALEVQSELDGLNLPKERNYRAGMAGLAMAFVIYGIASQSPPLAGTSIAALLATFAHLRTAEREHDSEVGRLISTPAYALLKAKEIITRR